MMKYTSDEESHIQSLLAQGWTPVQIAETMVGERTVEGLRRKIERMRQGSRGSYRSIDSWPIGASKPHGWDCEPPCCGTIDKVPEPETDTGHIVGVIGDTHWPFNRREYLEFCADTFEKWGCTHIVHIGDAFDNHAGSYHESDPNGMSAGDEFAAALEEAHRWYKAFPVVSWVSGNHDDIFRRKIMTAGLPAQALQANVYQSPPGWIKAKDHFIDGVEYTHKGRGSIHGARNLAVARGDHSVVTGHSHSVMGVAYITVKGQDNGFRRPRFAVAAGSGIDDKRYAFKYAEGQNASALGCSVVSYGVEAHSIPMLTGCVRGGFEK